ncbi:MAG: PTS sugar transporter subunit IIB [Erysipelothrix sp.]|jgi:PTS system mannose-specific IIB component|nr:PTS sugar transporter subunit IIB [Erysipelothrix sp.]
MKNLVFTRIDDRLIHGQVIAAWLRTYSNVQHIIVIDDKTSEDPFMHEMFSLLVPSGITIEILSVEKAVELLKNELQKPTMIIVKTPLTIMQLLEGGIEFESINIGGMGMTKGRKKLFQNISSSPEENEMIKEMLQRGIRVEIQIIPAAKVVNLANILK